MRDRNSGTYLPKKESELGFLLRVFTKRCLCGFTLVHVLVCRWATRHIEGHVVPRAEVPLDVDVLHLLVVLRPLEIGRTAGTRVHAWLVVPAF